jgi:hypothetical protein
MLCFFASIGMFWVSFIASYFTYIVVMCVCVCVCVCGCVRACKLMYYNVCVISYVRRTMRRLELLARVREPLTKNV